MKRIPAFTTCTLLAAGLLFYACQKEVSCENCNANQPPVAAAGADQEVILPRDSTFLDGSGSHDRDGFIIKYKWTQASGPAAAVITHPDSSKTTAGGLAPGMYQFSLKVTDDKGASAADTMRVFVNSVTGTNHPPIAKAGDDETIALPGYAMIDGSASTDPDNNITAYLWTKVSGPSQFKITNPASVRTTVTNLIPGVYGLELMVTDAGGLTSKDTVHITVTGAIATTCSSTRPNINVLLMPFATLSQRRGDITLAAAGNKILFAGGSAYTIAPYGFSRVDLYDIGTNTWSAAELSQARGGMATVTAGNKIFFAGGRYIDISDHEFFFSTVDIYDASTNTWSVASLSRPRAGIAAAMVGNKIFFAGGMSSYQQGNITNTVDIYDLSSNSWSTATLSEPRANITAVTANNKIYFAGGISGYNIYNNSARITPSNTIDIYDNATNTWSVSTLTEARYNMAGIYAGGKIYWAGGIKPSPPPSTAPVPSCLVEVYDVNSQNKTSENLYQPNFYSTIDGQNAIVKDNKIVFFGLNGEPIQPGGTWLDIYDMHTHLWFTGTTNTIIEEPLTISVNHVIYLVSLDKVWKLDF